MFLFLKIILAHLIADFVLQFEELYRLKVRSFLGQLAHVFVHGMVTTVLLFPYLNEPLIWVFIVALMLEHLAQDLIKYRFTKKAPQKTFVYYAADQLFHFLALSAILLFPVANEVRGFPGNAALDTLYKNNTLTVFFIFFITLTFAANYTFHAFYKSCVKGARPLHWISSREMTWAIIERSVIAAAVLLGREPFWIVLSLFIGFLRLPFRKLRNLRDFLVSAGYALILSFIFRGLL